MLKDLRHAARLLLGAKGWTTVVVLSLALGIGANTALFSAIDGMLLAKLPVRDPDTLVRLKWSGRNDMVTSSSDYGSSRPTPDGQRVRSTFSYPMFQQLRASNKTMTDLLASAPMGSANVVVDGRADIAHGFISTGNFYQLLGIGARLGRTILPDDDRPDAAPVAMISSRYWHSRFGTDPTVVGRTMKINDVPVTIVGVLPADFIGIQRTGSEPPDFTVPLALDTRLNIGEEKPRLGEATYWWLQVMGRLKPGVTAAQVQGNLEGVFRSSARAGLDAYLKALPDEERGTSRNRSRTEIPRLRVEPGARGIYDVNTSEQRSVAILSGVVALVLLIVCANVANLLLSRATSRQKEISVRLSLGATRARLIRQLLTESLLLAALGGALGVLVAYWGSELMPGLSGRTATLDWRVLAFVLAITGLTGLVFGLAPALRGTGVSVSSALKDTSRSVVGSRSVLSKTLLIAQVAISLVLLVGAGLFLRTLQNLRHVNVGFNPENLLLLEVNPTLNRYDDPRVATLYRNLLERLGGVPGVTGVTLSRPALLTGNIWSTDIYVQGRPGQVKPDGSGGEALNFMSVAPNFFEVMQIPVLLGRPFTERDGRDAPKVALINQAAVRRLFPGENPVGHRIGSSPETAGEMEVVGVVGDAMYEGVREPAPPTMFVPYLQPRRLGTAVLELRTAANPTAATGAVREAIRQIDANLPIMDVSTQIEEIEQRFAQEKTFAQAYTLFGALALLLAAIGLFGLMSYNVARRTNEIGIRMALGAHRGDVLRMVMRESMRLVVVGVVVGVAGAIAAGRFIATLLFGLPPTDVGTIALAVVVMALVSAIAGYLPARRAAGVDPMVALRYE